MRVPDLIYRTADRLQISLGTPVQMDLSHPMESPIAESIDNDGDIPALLNDEFEDEGFEGFEPLPQLGLTVNKVGQIDSEISREMNRRIKADLRAVRFAGFKVGIVSGMEAESSPSILSISIRAAKLGMSAEVLQAWGLDQTQYIILLLRYTGRYRTFESIISESAKSGSVEFRIGVSRKYRPTLKEAVAVFSSGTKDEYNSVSNINDGGESCSKQTGYSNTFISNSLNDFLNEQFISLLKIRRSLNTDWDGAKLYLNHRQSRPYEIADLDFELPINKSTDSRMDHPEILSADHLADGESTQLSFPLISMQFTLRYLVRCTEFCLVCHDKVEGSFEALKPYVCSKPLCLYQYMSLGFGPNIEHDLLTQPYVVDLLISFCYASAQVKFLGIAIIYQLTDT